MGSESLAAEWGGSILDMINKCKIAIDARSAQYQGGGVTSYSVGLIQALSAVSDVFDYVFVLDSRLPVSCIDFPANSHFIYTTSGKASWLTRDIWEQVILPQILKRQGIDLFHGLDYVVPIAQTSFVRVATFHDATVFTPLDDRQFLSKARVRFLLKRIAANVDAIVTDSDFSKQEIYRYIPYSRNKVERIWCGIAETFFTPCSENCVEACLNKAGVTGNYILYYGGFKKHKRVDLLLRAFELVVREYPINLVLVGSLGNVRREIDDTILSLGLTKSVKLFGFATEDELKVLLDRCTVFVCPSAMEGFGLPIAEAMARGAPVVCSSAGSLPEIAGDAAWCFSGNEPQDLAAAMLEVVKNENLQAQLRQRGLIRSRRFTWRSAIDQLRILYLDLIEEKQSAKR